MSTTETKVTHTPTPWTVNVWTTGRRTIENEMGLVIAEVHRVHNEYGIAANAEFIVRAVNSHADMLEALESAQAIIQLWHDDAKLPKAQEYLAKHLARIGAAIAKARGVA